jgi:2',3'-cyclic-nucleotide 2'-phosphodiesterase (5'-nucleotidase family)
MTIIGLKESERVHPIIESAREDARVAVTRRGVRRSVRVLLGVLVLVCVRPARTTHAQDATAFQSGAQLTILQLNDVYETMPTGALGGLARVATLKQNVAKSGATPIAILAGDFLSSSVASSVFKGEQMIDAFNAMGLDLATLGNHEFDFGKDVLLQRMAASRFQYVVANVLDESTGRPVGGAAPYLIRTFNGLKVGFFGLCLTHQEISGDHRRGFQFLDPIEAAGSSVAALRRDGAQAIVAITHLAYADDRELARRFPEINLIVGGHEHFPITSTAGATLISKSGSDAKVVARIDLRYTNGVLERLLSPIPIDASLPDDPGTAAVVAKWEGRLSDALNEVVGRTEVALNAESRRLRTSESEVGNLITDAMRADTRAQVAIINSGSIRGDRVFPAGPITRRTLLALQPFGNVVCVVEASGRVLLTALNHGVSKLPASAGQFPDVSGLTMRVELTAPEGDRVRDVEVGGQRLDLAKRYTIALPDYLLSGGDGYTMFQDGRTITGPEAGTLIVSATETYVAAQKTVAPKIEGRITIR